MFDGGFHVVAAGIEAEEVAVARPMRLRLTLGCASAPIAKAEMARRELEVTMMKVNE